MSNTALSSARRRRAIPSIAPISQQQQQQQHQQMQQQHQRVMQQQQQQQQQSVAAAPVISNGAGPYTQRPPIQGQSIPVSLLQQQQQQRQVINASVKQSPPVQTPQFIKPGSVIPPGYVQTIHANGLPQIECVETGTINFPYAEPPLPPIIILRNHDKQLLQLEGQHNDIANQFAHLTSRVNHLEGGVMISSNSGQDQDQDQDQPPFDITLNSEFINDLTGNNLFIANVVENIMKNTNLSDMVNEIEPIKADNRELRSLVLTQQEMLNGMNSLLFKLLNRANDSACACACMCATAQHPDTPEVVADVAVADVAVADVVVADVAVADVAEVAVADEVVAVAETIDTTPTVHAIDSEIRISVTEIDDSVYAEPAASDEIVAPVETSPSSQE